MSGRIIRRATFRERPGFPLSRRDRSALDAMSGEAVPRPRGTGAGTIGNLVKRRWIVRVRDARDPSVELYTVTPHGRLAVEIDDAVVNSGLKRPGPAAGLPGAQAYADLVGLLRRLKEGDERRVRPA